MTILGCLAQRDFALVWSDTLVTSARSRKPIAHRDKVVVSPIAGILGVGCGWAGLAECARSAIRHAGDFDTAVPQVARAIRRGIGGVAPSLEAVAPFSFLSCEFMMVGWSRIYDRFLGYQLSASRAFEPVLATMELRPRIDIGGRYPNLDEVRRIAAWQAAEHIAAGGRVGRLTIATIDRAGLHVLPPEEIAPLAPPVCREGEARGGRESPRTEPLPAEAF